MEIFTFDRAERAIEQYASTGAAAGRIPLDRPATHATCLTIAPGGTIGRHPAPVPRLFLVIAGEGWVAGADVRQRHRAHRARVGGLSIGRAEPGVTDSCPDH